MSSKEQSISYMYVSHYFPPPFVGGSVVYGHYLHSSFGEEMLVLAPNHPDSRAHDQGLPYRVLRSPWALSSDVVTSRWRRLSNGVLLFFRILWLIKKFNIKILHVGNLGKLALTAYLLAMLTGVKTVITLHGEELTTVPNHTAWLWGYPGRFMNAILVFCARRLDCVIVPSPTTERVLLEMQFKPQHLTVITPGIDEAKVQTRAVLKIPQGLPNDISTVPFILCVGRLIPRKGQDVLVQAMPKVLEKFPNTNLVLAGGGPCEMELRELVQSLGLSSHIHLLSQASNEDVAWLYAHCALFCMPNRTLANGDTEGYGIVFLEAGAWGKPVVAGRAGGAVDAVEAGVTGHLVDPENPNAVAEAILRLLRDPALCAKIGEAGRLKAQRNGWRLKSEQFKKLLGEI